MRTETTTLRRPRIRPQQEAGSGLHITRRDLAIIHDVARFKFLTARHIQSRHFGGTNDNNAANRLAKLSGAGLLSRVYVHPKIRGQEKAHPTAVYFFAPRNQSQCRAALEAAGQASEWESLARDLPSYNKKTEYSPLYLFHELGISDFFLSLEAATGKSSDYSIDFWERTSPFSKDIGAAITGHAPNPETGAKTAKLHFNPDGFFAIRHRSSGAHFFYFLEYDNNTATAAKFRQKLYGYMAYQQQGRFAVLLERYNEKYMLGLRNIERAGFRVVTVTPSDKRRDDLFLDSLHVRDEHDKARYKMFLYVSLGDVLKRGTFDQVCLRGKDYAPIAEEEKRLPKGISQASLRRWQSERLPTMRRISVCDE